MDELQAELEWAKCQITELQNIVSGQEIRSQVYISRIPCPANHCAVREQAGKVHHLGLEYEDFQTFTIECPTPDPNRGTKSGLGHDKSKPTPLSIVRFSPRPKKSLHELPTNLNLQHDPSHEDALRYVTASDTAQNLKAPNASHKPYNNMLAPLISPRRTANLPEANVKIPIVPLSDEEIIVFFFNHVQWPMVSLRLYARGKTPAKIVEILNEHREMQAGGYRRNTCCVRCTAAIKRGERHYGPNWKGEWTRFFQSEDDAKATDAMVQAKWNPRKADQDYSNVLNLIEGLKKFPKSEAGETGYFTKALKWCYKHNKNVPLSAIFPIALAFRKPEDQAKDLEKQEPNINEKNASPDYGKASDGPLTPALGLGFEELSVSRSSSDLTDSSPEFGASAGIDGSID